MYRVILDVDGKEYERTLRLEGDPTLPADIAALIATEEVNPRDAAEEEEERERRGEPDPDESEPDGGEPTGWSIT